MNSMRYAALSAVVLAFVTGACSSSNTSSNSSTGGVTGYGAAGFVGTGGMVVGSGGVPGSGGVTGGGGVVVGGSGNGGSPAIGGASSGGVSNGGVGGTASGGVSSGGVAGSTGGVGGVSSGGAAGAAGGGGGGIDLTGTWVSEVKTTGKLSAPVVGMTDVNIDLVIRLSLMKAAGKLNGTFAICRLTTTTTPDPKSLVVTFTDKVMATMKSNISENDFTPTIGGDVPVPAIEILTGQDAMMKQVDSDGDGKDGDTVPSNIGGILMLNAYVGFDIKVTMMSKLTDANTITGTTGFTTTGTVFGSDNPLLSSGNINVTPSSQAVPFTAKKLAGDVACAQVVAMFPAM